MLRDHLPRRLLGLAAVAALAACADGPTGSAPAEATVRLYASVTPTVRSLVVEVAAPDLAQPVSFTFAAASGTVNATLTLPAGSDRSLTLRAYDIGGVETHRGARTVTVRAGANPALDITLLPLAGDLPITASMGTRVLAVTPGATTLLPGDTARFAATVVVAGGASVPTQPRWSSANPAIAMIDTAGKVTALAPGATQIVATSGAAIASVSLTVSDPTAPVTFASLHVGNEFTCGLTSAGEAWCWGRNDFGQIGSDGGDVTCGSGEGVSPPCSPRPRRVGTTVRFTALAAGSYGACGLDSGGVAYCWGANAAGELGLGTSDALRHPVPTRVTDSLRFTSLVAAERAACALNAAGAAYCWGGHYQGQLGIGNTDEFCHGFRDTPVACSSRPARVAGGLTFSRLVAGHRAGVCALTVTGAAHCWGAARQGGLGDGLSTGVVPTPVAVAGGHLFSSLAAGYLSACGRTTAGATVCWGDNPFGHFGPGIERGMTALPLAVGWPAFTQFAVGGLFACGLLSDGAAECAGSSHSGQLGDFTSGHGRSSSTFVRVAGGHRFRAIGASFMHACGLRTDGRAVCWGHNASGQLGDGTLANSAAPREVVGPGARPGAGSAGPVAEAP